LKDGRFAIWARNVPLLKDFSLWGSGYGTFPYLDQPHQTKEKYHVVDYAHNEYLEGWIEGGPVRLCLTIFMVSYLIGCGWRGALAGPSRESRCLALGALFGLTTLALHCSVDFMMHLPAIVVLGTVIAAHLSGIETASVR